MQEVKRIKLESDAVQELLSRRRELIKIVLAAVAKGEREESEVVATPRLSELKMVQTEASSTTSFSSQPVMKSIPDALLQISVDGSDFNDSCMVQQTPAPTWIPNNCLLAQDTLCETQQLSRLLQKDVIRPPWPEDDLCILDTPTKNGIQSQSQSQSPSEDQKEDATNGQRPFIYETQPKWLEKLTPEITERRCSTLDSSKGTPGGKFFTGGEEIKTPESKVHQARAMLALTATAQESHEWVINESNKLYQAGYFHHYGDGTENVFVGGSPVVIVILSSIIAKVVLFESESKKELKKCASPGSSSTKNIEIRDGIEFIPPSGTSWMKCCTISKHSQKVFLTTNNGILHCCDAMAGTTLWNYDTRITHVQDMIYFSWNVSNVYLFVCGKDISRISMTPTLEIDSRYDEPLMLYTTQPGIVHCVRQFDKKRPLIAATVSTDRAQTYLGIWDFEKGSLVKMLELTDGVHKFAPLSDCRWVSVISSTRPDSISLCSWTGSSWSQRQIASLTGGLSITAWDVTPNTNYVLLSSGAKISAYSVVSNCLTAEITLQYAAEDSPQSGTREVTSVQFHPSQPVVCFNDSLGIVWIYVAE